MTPAEEPAITIRLGWSLNPLRWAYALVRLLGFAFMFWIAWLLYLKSFGGILALLVIAFFFLRFLNDLLSVDRSIYRFFDDRIEVDYRPSRLGVADEHRTHSYEEIGHIELTSLKLVKIFFATPEGRALVAEIPMNPRVGEDFFDEIVDHVQAIAPEHVFSIFEHGHVRFSNEVSFADLFPGHTEAIDRVRVHGRMIYAGNRAYCQNLPDVYVTDGKDQSLLFRVTQSHILSTKSVVLAAVSTEQYRKVRIAFFDENEYSIDGVDGSVRLDGETIGSCEEQGGVIRVALHRPIPTIAALIVTMAFASHRAKLRIHLNGVILPAERCHSPRGTSVPRGE